jgi:crotonobetainyl-CoA:carnitine CoA-transferase CaiB-like acyl-CoA transferase
MTQPFAGVRVLDLTHVLAGPFCTYQLAVLGADVVKIEPPGLPDCARGRGPDPAANAALRGLNYEVQGGNKRALALDLKRPAGRDVLLRLATRADVLVENYRAGALAALGLGDDALRAANGALVPPAPKQAVRRRPARRSSTTRAAGAPRSPSRRRSSSGRATAAASASTARCSTPR